MRTLLLVAALKAGAALGLGALMAGCVTRFSGGAIEDVGLSRRTVFRACWVAYALVGVLAELVAR